MDGDKHYITLRANGADPEAVVDAIKKYARKTDPERFHIALAARGGPEIIRPITPIDPDDLEQRFADLQRRLDAQILQLKRRATARKARQRRQWAKVRGGRRDG